MKNILILGNSGQLGSALMEEFSKHLDEYQLIGLNSKNVDIRNVDNLYDVFQKNKPNIVINTVAYTNVEQAECEPRLAYDLNLFGAQNVAQACLSLHSDLIHISTDYVFGAIQRKFLDEDENPNPLNQYGMSKLSGELAVKTTMRNSGCAWYIVRSSSLYGSTPNASKGTFLLNCLKQLKNHDNVYLNDENFMSPTNVEDLSCCIYHLSDSKSGLYHIVNHGTVTPYNFILKAVDIIKNHNLSNKYYYENIIKVPLVNSCVQRPKFSFLGTSKKTKFTMPTWESALESFLVKHVELL